MLVNLNEVLGAAQKGGYAVGLFNTINLEMARAVIAAAEQVRSPVIIGSAEVLLQYANMDELAEMLVPAARRASVPVVLHFDHGFTPALLYRAIRCGFSSIMYDCSSLSYCENVREVAQMTKAAHALGVSVEAELGHVGSGAQSAEAMPDDKSIYTQPEEARDYVEKTQVDALAVAIGTAHGSYVKTPVLDIVRLTEIRKAVAVPLVLHGGSGLSEADIKNCIHGGIAKINVFTDIDIAGGKAARISMQNGAVCLTQMLPAMKTAIQKTAMEKMCIFGSAEKA